MLKKLLSIALAFSFIGGATLVPQRDAFVNINIVNAQESGNDPENEDIDITVCDFITGKESTMKSSELLSRAKHIESNDGIVYLNEVGTMGYMDGMWVRLFCSDYYMADMFYLNNDNCPENLVIKDNVDGVPVKGLMGRGFMPVELFLKIKTVSIPDTIARIEKNAFLGCNDLKSVTIPKSVKTIDNNAFGYTYDKDYKIIKVPGFVINCYKGTAAEKYAIDNGIEYNLLDVPDEYNMTKAIVSGISAKTYTGSAIKQKPLVKLGTKTLKNDIDYTITYKNNIKIGTATIMITGKGNYIGTVSKTFKITGVSISKATVSSLSNKTYTGKAITQKPVVKLNGKTLKSGTDYTVSYKNNKAIGTATVTITGKGVYTGTAKATFKINPKKTTLKNVTSPKTKQLKATYSKVSGITGYQVTYSTSSKFTKATTKSVNVKGTSKTISKLAKGKTYYVKVRTYKTVGKTKYYSGYSSVKKIKVK